MKHQEHRAAALRAAGLAVLLAAALAGGGPSGVKARPAGIRVMGATSLAPFLAAMATRYHAQHPEAALVHVAAGGSLAGLHHLQRGAADAAASDIPPLAVLGGARARKLSGRVLGRLPVVLVVHRGVGVTQVSRARATRLLTGHVRSWQELGGAAENVVVVTRALGSGALWVVEHQLLQGAPVSDRAVVQWSNGAVVKAVAATPGAIGFVDAGFVRPGVRVLGLGSAAYQARDPAAWPLYATAGLYWRRPARPALAAWLAFLAAQPDRARFGIVEEGTARHGASRSTRTSSPSHPGGDGGRAGALDGGAHRLAGGGYP